MKKKAIKSYTAASEELQQIVQELQEGTVTIDELSMQVERAQKLIQYCRDKLRQTESQINESLDRS